MKRYWLYLIFTSIAVLICAFVYVRLRKGHLQPFVAEIGSESEPESYLDKCFKKHCAVLDAEFQKQCKRLKEKCVFQNGFSIEQCILDAEKLCDGRKVQNCKDTCLQEMESSQKKEMEASMVKEQHGEDLTPPSKWIDISQRAIPLENPLIQFYGLPVYTLSMTIKVDQPADGWRYVFSMASDADSGQTFPIIAVSTGTPFVIGFHHPSKQNKNPWLVMKHIDLQYGKSFHYTIVVNESNAKHYLNGKPMGSLTLSEDDTDHFIWGLPKRTMTMNHPAMIPYSKPYGALQVKDVKWFTMAFSDLNVDNNFKSISLS